MYTIYAASYLALFSIKTRGLNTRNELEINISTIFAVLDGNRKDNHTDLQNNNRNISMTSGIRENGILTGQRNISSSPKTLPRQLQNDSAIPALPAILDNDTAIPAIPVIQTDLGNVNKDTTTIISVKENDTSVTILVEDDFSVTSDTNGSMNLTDSSIEETEIDGFNRSSSIGVGKTKVSSMTNDEVVKENTNKDSTNVDATQNMIKNVSPLVRGLITNMTLGLGLDNKGTVSFDNTNNENEKVMKNKIDKSGSKSNSTENQENVTIQDTDLNELTKDNGNVEPVIDESKIMNGESILLTLLGGNVAGNTTDTSKQADKKTNITKEESDLGILVLFDTESKKVPVPVVSTNGIDTEDIFLGLLGGDITNDIEAIDDQNDQKVQNGLENSFKPSQADPGILSLLCDNVLTRDDVEVSNNMSSRALDVSANGIEGIMSTIGKEVDIQRESTDASKESTDYKEPKNLKDPDSDDQKGSPVVIEEKDDTTTADTLNDNDQITGNILNIILDDVVDYAISTGDNALDVIKEKSPRILMNATRDGIGSSITQATDNNRKMENQTEIEPKSINRNENNSMTTKETIPNDIFSILISQVDRKVFQGKDDIDTIQEVSNKAPKSVKGSNRRVEDDFSFLLLGEVNNVSVKIDSTELNNIGQHSTVAKTIEVVPRKTLPISEVNINNDPSLNPALENDELTLLGILLERVSLNDIEAENERGNENGGYEEGDTYEGSGIDEGTDISNEIDTINPNDANKDTKQEKDEREIDQINLPENSNNTNLNQFNILSIILSDAATSIGASDAILKDVKTNDVVITGQNVNVVIVKDNKNDNADRIKEVIGSTNDKTDQNKNMDGLVTSINKGNKQLSDKIDSDLYLILLDNSEPQINESDSAYPVDVPDGNRIDVKSIRRLPKDDRDDILGGNIDGSGDNENIRTGYPYYPISYYPP
jgi:hypothetical protein